ncbi:MAG: hypothetical protein QJR02_11455 [Sinobacteraceae bacterium]|nr:hypothetical protein [Nevskiaceae bacterium]
MMTPVFGIALGLWLAAALTARGFTAILKSNPALREQMQQDPLQARLVLAAWVLFCTGVGILLGSAAVTLLSAVIGGLA